MRMMSDDEFRDSLGKAASAAAIDEILKKESYDFSKFDLLKVVGELTGKKIEPQELEKMVCGFYAEEVAGSSDQKAFETVTAWFAGLK